MKTIFITGSESFIGKELIAQCLKQNIGVVGCDLVEGPSQQYKYYKADIRDATLEAVTPENLDAIVHLAALSRDQDCKGRAYECFDVNVMGTLNVIRIIQQRKAKQFIFASTEWVYDTFEGAEEKDEEAVINIANHTSEYAMSKLISECNLRQQYQLGFCPVTILRFGIVYGPRETNWSAVESLMSAVKSQEGLTVGSVKTARRFIHVSDLARGIIASFGLGGFEILNMTGNRLIAIGEIIETSQQILNKKVKIIEVNPAHSSIRNPTNKKARQLLGWEPQVELEEGLKTLIPYL